MEDKQIQPSAPPQLSPIESRSSSTGPSVLSPLEPLKIRTMQEDLKKIGGQTPNPVTRAIPAKPATLAPPVTPKAPAIPQAMTAATARPAPEPPSHLPGATPSQIIQGVIKVGSPPGPISSISPRPVAPSPPQPPSGPVLPKPPAPAPPPPPAPKPAVGPKPAFGEPPKKPVPPAPTPQPTVSPAFGPYKKLAIGGAISLLLAAGAYYFWPVGEPEPPEPACQGEISPNCPPVSILNNIDLLTLNAGERSQAIGDIKSKMSETLEPAVKLIALKKSANPDTYITFDELINLFGLSVSSQIKENTTNFNLLAHINPPEHASSSVSQPKTEKDIRLVLVLKQKDASSTKEAMQLWEDEMVGDLEPLLLETSGRPPLATFSTRVYHDGSFRYFSVPDYHLAINYVITGDYLIIGTSRESIFYVYDALTGKN